MPSYSGLSRSAHDCGTGGVAQRVDVHEEAERALMGGEPATLGVLETVRDVLEAGRLVGLDDALLGRLDARRDAVIGDVGDRVALLRQKLGQGLARVLVVVRHLNAEVRLDRVDHRGPVGPLGRAVVADRVGGPRGGRREERTGENAGGGEVAKECGGEGTSWSFPVETWLVACCTDVRGHSARRRPGRMAAANETDARAPVTIRIEERPRRAA